MWLRTYATLNINGLNNKITRSALRTFLNDNDIDLLCLQEVNNSNLDFLTQYEYRTNIGDDNRGTAMVYRPGAGLDHFQEDPEGKIITATTGSDKFVNVYGPSGSNKRAERELLYHTRLPPYLHGTPNVIMCGDWNATLHAKDQRGTINTSNSLRTLVTQLDMTDVWEHIHGNMVQYTFHRGNSASRLDRIYVSRALVNSIHSVKVIPASFSDHDALLLRMSATTPLPCLGRGYWKLNTSLLINFDIRELFSAKWESIRRTY